MKISEINFPTDGELINFISANAHSADIQNDIREKYGQSYINDLHYVELLEYAESLGYALAKK